MPLWRRREGPEPTLDELLHMIGSPREGERTAAALALGSIPDPRAQAALRVALNDRKWVVRKAAKDALDRLERTGVESAEFTLRIAAAGDYVQLDTAARAWCNEPLPRLLAVHLRNTTFLAEDRTGAVVGFLCGFLSQSEREEACVLLVGVDPDSRRRGAGRALVERFCGTARSRERKLVRAEAPDDPGALAFLEALGFGREGADVVRRV
jgi:ribosomal protein S18 acetylase RimI-like enzyme